MVVPFPLQGDSLWKQIVADSLGWADGGQQSVLYRIVVVILMDVLSQLAVTQQIENLNANVEESTFPVTASYNSLAAQKVILKQEKI